MTDIIPLEIIEKINNNNFYFIQIGANDGITSDPIFHYINKYNWSGLMFEPQEKPFKKLKKLYDNNQNVLTEKIGIAENSGVYKLYKHMPNTINTQDHSGGSSLLLRRSAEFYEDCYEEINCITFKDIINKYSVSKIDLLVIDTEGYDMTIINSIDFNIIKPNNIWFEYWPYSNDDKNTNIKTSYEENIEVIEKLKSFGYKIYNFENNNLASLNWSKE